MSTIQAANISDGTDTVGTEYVINGSAKFWSFTDNSANTISSSYNMSSLTDNGVGNHVYNYTNSFSTTLSAVVLQSSGPLNTVHTHHYVSAVGASSHNHQQFADENSTLRADSGASSGIRMGDLA